MKHSKFFTMFVILFVLSVLLAACEDSKYNAVTNPVTDNACMAAGYDVSKPLAGKFTMIACMGDAYDNGVLDGSTAKDD